MFTIIFISGATASGKSDFVHFLIDKYFSKASILSVDSMQVYKFLSVGTAKPESHIQQKYHYEIVDCIDPKENFTLNKYLRLASEVIPKMSNPIFAVGGTGLYVNALKYGIFEEKDDNGVIRKQLYERFMASGIDSLYDELKKIDPISSQTIDKQNVRRVIRALEVYYKTGKLFSEMRELRKQVIPIRYLHYMLDKERDILYDHINKRVVSMFEMGLLDEVTSLMDYGVTLEHTSMQGIGYKECFKYISNNESDYNCLINEVQQNTRHFAKRQITWFKKENPIWIKNNEIEKVVRGVEEFCKND